MFAMYNEYISYPELLHLKRTIDTAEYIKLTYIFLYFSFVLALLFSIATLDYKAKPCQEVESEVESEVEVETDSDTDEPQPKLVRTCANGCCPIGISYKTYYSSFSDKALEERRNLILTQSDSCLLYTSPSPRDRTRSRMPSSA